MYMYTNSKTRVHLHHFLINIVSTVSGICVHVAIPNCHVLQYISRYM